MFESREIKGEAITIKVPAVSKWTITELRKCCKKHKIQGYTKMDRQQLIAEVEKIIAGIRKNSV